MKITVTTSGGVFKARLPYDGAGYVVVSGLECPECNAEGGLRVRGPSPVTDHDTMRSRAVCADCDQGVGHITVKFNTIFGIEEDKRVLNGRCRVY